MEYIVDQIFLLTVMDVLYLLDSNIHMFSYTSINIFLNEVLFSNLLEKYVLFVFLNFVSYVCLYSN